MKITGLNILNMFRIETKFRLRFFHFPPGPPNLDLWQHKMVSCQVKSNKMYVVVLVITIFRNPGHQHVDDDGGGNDAYLKT